jgi:hypothetical protein
MIEVRVSQEAARQLAKMIELFGSSILPNSELNKLLDQINGLLPKEIGNAREKEAESVRLPEPAPQRGGLVRAVKRGVNHFA